MRPKPYHQFRPRSPSPVASGDHLDQSIERGNSSEVHDALHMAVRPRAQTCPVARVVGCPIWLPNQSVSGPRHSKSPGTGTRICSMCLHCGCGHGGGTPPHDSISSGSLHFCSVLHLRTLGEPVPHNQHRPCTDSDLSTADPQVLMDTMGCAQAYAARLIATKTTMIIPTHALRREGESNKS